LTGAIILLVVGFVSWQLLWGSDLTIREIVVEGGERIPVAIVEKMLEDYVGVNLWRVNAGQVRFSLLQKFPWLRDAQIVKAYPHTLKAVVEERLPFVVIETHQRRSVWIDAEGYQLESARVAEIFQPKIRGLTLAETPLGVRATDENSLQTLRDFFALRGSFIAQFSEMVFDGSDVTLTSRAGFQVFLKNFRIKGDLSLLQRVLEESLDGSEYRYFDFRFNEMIAQPR
jgi:hypothetical protein